MTAVHLRLWIFTLFMVVVRAKLSFLESPKRVAIGSTYTISWTGVDGEVRLVYESIDGDFSWMRSIYSGTANQTNWSVTNDSSLTETEIYAFVISQGSGDDDSVASEAFILVEAPSSSQEPTTTTTIASSVTSVSSDPISTSSKPTSTSSRSTSTDYPADSTKTSIVLYNPASSLHPTNGSSDETSKLSAGTIAGIAIASAAVILLLVLSVLCSVFLWSRRKRDALKNIGHVSLQPSSEVATQEAVQLLGRPISYELPVGTRPISQELAGNTIRF